MASFLQALAPLAALFILHKILKTAGLGGLTKLSGSMGLATSAAVAAAGDRNWRNAAGKTFDGAAGKLGGRSSFGNTTKADKRAAVRKEIRKRAIGTAGTAFVGGLAAGAGKTGALKAAVGTYHNRSALERADLGVNRLHRLRELREAGQIGRSLNKLALDPAKPADPKKALAGLKTPGLSFGADPAVLATELDARRVELRNKLDGLPAGDPQRQALLLEMAQADSDQATLTMFGVDAVGRVLTTQEQLNAQVSYATTRGIDPAQVVVSSFGIVQEAPIVGGFLQAATVDGTIASLQSFRTWLPDLAKQRQHGPEGVLESDDEYASRLYHTGVMLGAIDPSTGKEVDWLKKNGIDVTTASGRQEALNYVNGQPSRLDNIATIEETSDVFMRTNAVRDILMPTQARLAPASLESAFNAQSTLVQEDVAVMAATGTAFATTAAPLETALAQLTAYATSAYENPKYAKNMKVLADAGILEVTNQLHDVRAQLTAALEAQYAVRSEVEVMAAVDAGEAERTTEEALAKMKSEYDQRVKDEVRAAMQEIETAIGETQKAFNRKNHDGSSLPLDPSHIDVATKKITELLKQQQEAITKANTDLQNQASRQLETAKNVMDSRLASYARIASSVQRRKSARDFV